MQLDIDWPIQEVHEEFLYTNTVLFSCKDGKRKGTGLACNFGDLYEMAFLFKAAFTLAFFGALTVRETVASSQRVKLGRALKPKDVIINKEDMRLVIQKHKTDQKGSEET